MLPLSTIFRLDFGIVPTVCYCYVIVMLLLCYCYVIVMLLLCYCYVIDNKNVDIKISSHDAFL